MSDDLEPRPLRESNRHLLSRVQPPRAPSMTVLHRAHEAALRGPRLAVKFAWGAGAAVAGFMMVALIWPAQPVPQSWESVAHVEPDAKLEALTVADARLSAGHFTGSPSKTLRHVSTPHATITWRQARFLVAVSDLRTELRVDEGEVVFVEGARSRAVHAGERAEAPAVIAPASFEVPAPPASAQTRCPVGSTRVGCLDALSRSADALEAQTALYERALLARDVEKNRDLAVQVLTSLQNRFPNGVFAPEVSVALIAESCRSARYAEALEQAKSFEARFPDDGFAGEVKVLRGQLERVVHESN